MTLLYGRMLKVVALAFLLVTAVHFAVPPSAAASCSCSNLSFNTSTLAGTGANCSTANTFLQVNIQNAVSAACFPYDPCHLDPIVITTACHLRSDGKYEVDGYQRYNCYVGTTCPIGH
jgi:hypothetical protein